MCNSKAVTSSSGTLQAKQELETQVLSLQQQSLLEHDRVDLLGNDLTQVG